MEEADTPQLGLLRTRADEPNRVLKLAVGGPEKSVQETVETFQSVRILGQLKFCTRVATVAIIKVQTGPNFSFRRSHVNPPAAHTIIAAQES